MEEITIRPYRRDDRPFVRDIAYGTAFMGESASIFFEGKEIMADFLTQYFTDYEPESCFVAVSNGKVVGYLLGTKDAAALAKVFTSKILFPLFIRALRSGVFFKKNNTVFILRSIFSLMKGEFKMPDFYQSYPATLHINLEKGFRGLRIGSRLMNDYLDYLMGNKITGVHLATISEKASDFFRQQGFCLLHKGERSYFWHILKKNLPIYIYGKKLA